MNIFVNSHSSYEISLKVFLLKVFVGLKNAHRMSEKKHGGCEKTCQLHIMDQALDLKIEMQ